MTLNYKFKKLNETFAIGEPIEFGYTSVRNLPIVFMVGLTGSGVSSTIEEFIKRNNNILVLPSRQSLSDQISIPWSLERQNKPLSEIKNRKIRYEMNKFFRKFHKGGMAEIVEQMSYKGNEHNFKLTIFDSLRHVGEIVYAKRCFKKVNFVVMKANPVERTKRIASSEYSFSNVGNSHVYTNLFDIPGWNKAFSKQEMGELSEYLESGKTDLLSLNQAIQILIKEGQEYDHHKLIMKLYDIAHNETLVIDSTEKNPKERAEEIGKWMGSKSNSFS